MFVEPKIENVMTNDFYDLLLSCAENQASKSKDDFVHGGICAIKELWHGSEEEPEGGTDIHRDIIVRGEKGVKIYPNPANSNTSWTFFCRISRLESWAFVDDIIPGVK